MAEVLRIILFMSVLASALRSGKTHSSDKDDERLTLSGRRFYEVEKSKISQLDGKGSHERHCICAVIPPGERKLTVSEQLNPYKIPADRLVVYLYKVDGRVNLYIPTAEKQHLLPDLPLDDYDVLQEVEAKPFIDLIDDSPYVISKKHFKDVPDVDFELPEPQEDRYKLYLYKQILQHRLQPEDPVTLLIKFITENRDQNKIPTSVLLLLESLIRPNKGSGEYPNKEEDAVKPDYYDLPYRNHTHKKVTSSPYEPTITATPTYDKEFVNLGLLPVDIFAPSTEGPIKDPPYEDFPKDPEDKSSSEPTYLPQPYTIITTIVPEDDRQIVNLDLQPARFYPSTKEPILKLRDHDLPQDLYDGSSSEPTYFPQADPINELPLSNAPSLVYESSEKYPSYLIPQSYNQVIKPLVPITYKPGPIDPYIIQSTKSPELEALPLFPAEPSKFSLNYDRPVPKFQDQDALEIYGPNVQPERESLIFGPLKPIPKSNPAPGFPLNYKLYPELENPSFQDTSLEPFDFNEQKLYPDDKKSVYLNPPQPFRGPGENYVQYFDYDLYPDIESPEFQNTQPDVPNLYPHDKKVANIKPVQPPRAPAVDNVQNFDFEFYPDIDNPKFQETSSEFFDYDLPESYPDHQRPIFLKPIQPYLQPAVPLSPYYLQQATKIPNILGPSLEPLDFEVSKLPTSIKPVAPVLEPAKEYVPSQLELSPNIVFPTSQETLDTSTSYPENEPINLKPLQLDVKPSEDFSQTLEYELYPDIESPKFQDTSLDLDYILPTYPHSEDIDLSSQFPEIDVITFNREEFLVDKPNIISEYPVEELARPPEDTIALKFLTSDQLPSWEQLLPQQQRPEDKKLTFDKWFAGELKVIKKPENLNVYTLKITIEKILRDNQIKVTEDGMLIDDNGKVLNTGDLKLRPLLIGKPLGFDNLLNNDVTKKLKLSNAAPYWYSLLVSLDSPSRILGLIPLGEKIPVDSSEESNEVKDYLSKALPDLSSVVHFHSSIVHPAKLISDTYFDVPNSEESIEVPESSTWPIYTETFKPEIDAEPVEALPDGSSVVYLNAIQPAKPVSQIYTDVPSSQESFVVPESSTRPNYIENDEPEIEAKLIEAITDLNSVVYLHPNGVKPAKSVSEIYFDIPIMEESFEVPESSTRPVYIETYKPEIEAKPLEDLSDLSSIVQWYPSGVQPAKSVSEIYFDVDISQESFEVPESSTRPVYIETYKPEIEANPVEALPDLSSVVYLHPSVVQPAKPVSEIYFDVPSSQENFEEPEASTLPVYEVTDSLVLDGRPVADPVEAFPHISSLVHLYPSIAQPGKPYPVPFFDAPDSEEGLEIPESSTTTPTQQVYTDTFKPENDASYVVLDGRPLPNSIQTVPDFSSVIHLQSNQAQPAKTVSEIVFDTPNTEESFEVPESSTRPIYTVTFKPDTAAEPVEALPVARPDEPVSISYYDDFSIEGKLKVPESSTTPPTHEVYTVKFKSTTDKSYIAPNLVPEIIYSASNSDESLELSPPEFNYDLKPNEPVHNSVVDLQSTVDIPYFPIYGSPDYLEESPEAVLSYTSTVNPEVSTEPTQSYTEGFLNNSPLYYTLRILLLEDDPDVQSKLTLLFDEYQSQFVYVLNKILLDYKSNPTLFLKIKENIENNISTLESIVSAAQDLSHSFPHLQEDLEKLNSVLINNYNIYTDFKTFNRPPSPADQENKATINTESYAFVTQSDFSSSPTSDIPYFVTAPSVVPSPGPDNIYVPVVPATKHSSNLYNTPLYEILREVLLSDAYNLDSQLLYILEENPNDFILTLIELLSRRDFNPSDLLKIRQNIRVFIPRLVYTVKSRKIPIPNFDSDVSVLYSLLFSQPESYNTNISVNNGVRPYNQIPVTQYQEPIQGNPSIQEILKLISGKSQNTYSDFVTDVSTNEEDDSNDPNLLIKSFGPNKENLVPVLTQSLQDPELLAILSKNYPQLDFKLIAKYLREIQNGQGDGDHQNKLKRLVAYVYPRITRTRSQLVLPNVSKETLEQILQLIKSDPSIKIKAEVIKSPESSQKYYVSPNTRGSINNVNVFDYKLGDDGPLGKLFSKRLQQQLAQAEALDESDLERDGIKLGLEENVDVPEEQRVEENPEFRIIGGSPATGSGAPLSNKGREGIILLN